MTTRAFVLCSDEKALDAVSQILGELGIIFEQFHEIEFAAKRLIVQEFDLVVVDCDRQEDAAQLLECMRNSDLNRSAMTLAVVNGKAGVPTAFRLGADLIITKPVSLEQTRTTLRTAIAMRKKAHPEATTSAGSVLPVSPANGDAGKPKATLEFPQPAAKGIAPEVQPIKPALSTPVPSKQSAMKLPATAKPGLSLSMPASSRKQSAEMGSAPAESAQEKTTASRTERVGHPLPPQAFVQKPSGREPNRSLIAALVLAIIAGAGYAAYTVVPAFHSMANANYELIRSQIPGAKPAAANAPKPPTPVRVMVKPTPVPAVPPDGFVDATTANSLTAAAATTSSTPVILATTATTTTPEEPAPISVADELADQHVSTRVDPIYPESLRRKGVHGDVVLQTMVAKDGSVDSVTVISGNPQLAPAAMDAVKQWKYETYVHSGVAVGFQTNVTVEFAAPQKPPR